ncbi:multiple sugar transport system ATP-binding protein [Pedococcus cremeus]|uniref:Multiple sugar transport system ATP-binding protein n=1 Tax=Pedococcus cremeus TaxID=587636 RepID=A0A1H9XFN1_9MICO|nr:ABC transporter ATP-binding protein [Pedococcus cremeus]SES45000.1 multiple sugar transport system ATP-binding protein [Pedococcus cremeus]
MASVTLTGLVKEYPNGVRGVDGVDLQIADGEFFALLGPSGCGKTTLLRTLAGLEAATEGRIDIGDRDVTGFEPGERDVAMVFQDYALFPHMTVTDNIAYPLRIQKVGRDERSARALETAQGLSLAALMERRPAQLSGGQQQRVALARAIACHPQVFLFDEPLSNLDARLRLEARTFLKQLQKSLGVTTVFVTHDQAEALAMADRMAVMDGGRIRQVGTPREVFQRPANTFVANFIGATPMNLLDAQVVGGALDFGGFTLPVPGEGGRASAWPVAEGDKVVYGVRPEYVQCLPAPAEGAARGEVTAVENLGVSVLVTAQAGEQSVRAVVPESDEPALGDTVHLAPSSERVLLYRADGDGELIGR